MRAFARSAESIGLSNPRLEKQSGSALKVSDISSAMTGVDGVILTLGVRAGPGMVLGPVDLFSRATQIAIDAMKRARVKRLLCVTGFGAGDSRAKLGPLQAMFFQLLLGRAYDDKDVQETIVKAVASIGSLFGPSSSQTDLRPAGTRCFAPPDIGGAAPSRAPTSPIFSSNRCKIPRILGRRPC